MTGFDPGNGPIGGAVTYIAQGAGYKSENGTFSLPPFTNDVTINIVMQTVSGTGSGPEAHLPIADWFNNALVWIKTNWLLFIVIVTFLVILIIFTYSALRKR